MIKANLLSENVRKILMQLNSQEEITWVKTR